MLRHVRVAMVGQPSNGLQAWHSRVDGRHDGLRIMQPLVRGMDRTGGWSGCRAPSCAGKGSCRSCKGFVTASIDGLQIVWSIVPGPNRGLPLYGFIRRRLDRVFAGLDMVRAKNKQAKFIFWERLHSSKDGLTCHLL